MAKETNTHIDYKINKMIDLGNKKNVYFTIYKGVYQDVVVNEVTVNQYVRKEIVYRGNYLFDKFPVDMSEVKAMLKTNVAGLNTRLTLISECQ